MTPEYLGSIRGIYEAALDKEGAERAAFLDERCQGDAAVRRDVELLLAAQQRVPRWLDGPLLAALPQLDPEADSPRMEGRQLGAYTVRRLIGRGGMGHVYLAERSDGAFSKQVAIKLVQPGANGTNILARFQQEREILASLDHPGIARFLDASTTEEGLPYFVMEFVIGLPIDRWCDQQKLNVTQRIELFRKVCGVVHYAHQRLVVHRDLKPANILVTPGGEVKLLDFGIAKLLPRKPEGDEATRTLMAVMTPGYASPEQLNGDRITTLTDVYSLGVILYELLTGHRPHHSLRPALREIARALAEDEPTRPSEVIATTEERLTPQAVSEVREGDPNRLRKRLEGDLDCIVLTALRKQPVRRYSSAEALGEDLGRHLENVPVTAREDSFWYRASRFVRRYPGSIAMGLLIVFSLGIGVLTTLWETRITLSGAAQGLSGRTVMAPEMALFLYVALAGFGVAAYLMRATLRMAISCLAAGVVFAAAWMLKLKIDYVMGWWRSAFPDTPDPLTLFSIPLMFLVLSFGVAILFVGAWRIQRRFGWAGEITLVAGASLYFAVRDRIWWQDLMHMMVAKPGVTPIMADAVLFAVALTLGEVAKYLVAGPAGKDPLATRRTSRIASES